MDSTGRRGYVDQPCLSECALKATRGAPRLTVPAWATCVAVVVGTSLGGVIGWQVGTSHQGVAQQSHSLADSVHAHMHHRPDSRAALETAAACRSGAFVEAVAILNSVDEISHKLPASTEERTRAELDTVLFTALKQAHAELPCVAGVLSHGYDRAYAETIDRAVTLARMRELHPDVAQIGVKTVEFLRTHGAPPTR